MVLKIPMFFAARPKNNPARLACAIGIALLASGCSQRPAPSGMDDPNEVNNREIHEFNRSLDRALLRPAADVYGGLVPVPVQNGLSNMASNLDLPGDVVNNILQGRIHHALENTARFALNSTIGVLGVFDPATALGVAGKKTDFGHTLHVFGSGEGAYLELPGLGPSTERDLVGLVVDTVMNPVRLVLPKPESYIGTVSKVASTLGDRDRYSDTVDSILYESADSYAQLRLLYLQNRRFELGQTGGASDDFLDPYEDTADGSFIDPYEDPYAE